MRWTTTPFQDLLGMSDPIHIVTPPKRYQPVGYCIYCKTDTATLSDEHILPFGLAGDSLILPKASCLKCQKETGRVETICLRHLWWPFRTKIGAPSRNKPPENFSLKRMRVDGYDRENDAITAYTKLSMDELKPEEFPLFYQTFEFPPPGIFANRSTSNDIEYRSWCKIDDSEFRKFAGRDKEGFRLSPGEPEAFCRMIAKIAHAYAEAELGGSLFTQILTKYIRGAPLDRLQWIGCRENTPAPTAALHEIRITQEVIQSTNYLVIDIRLFACIGTPVYRVVVGELLQPLSQIPSIANSFYTVDIEGTIPFRDTVQRGGILRGGWH